MSKKIHILSTSLLDQDLIDRAGEKGMVIEALPFIQTAYVTHKEIEEELREFAELPITAVFTSANAVRAVAAMVGNSAPHWKTYCIGNATKEEVLERLEGSFIKGSADDSAALAEVILADDVREVVFFCGDKRMDTLPSLLQNEEVVVYEVVVYETAETPVKVTMEYDGILFFSPSGASSFFSLNTLSPHTALFAVGNTTAKAVIAHSGKNVVISETPSKEEVIETAMQYFNTQTITAINATE